MLCDAVVIYSGLDRAAAKKFVRDSPEYAGMPVEIRLYDDDVLFRDPSHAVDSSAVCFVFLTKRFVEEDDTGLMRLVTDELIPASVMNERWNVVPLFAERKGPAFRIPPSLNRLSGLPYYEELLGDGKLSRRFRDRFAGLMREAVSRRRRLDHSVSLSTWRLIKKPLIN